MRGRRGVRAEASLASRAAGASAIGSRLASVRSLLAATGSLLASVWLLPACTVHMSAPELLADLTAHLGDRMVREDAVPRWHSTPEGDAVLDSGFWMEDLDDVHVIANTTDRAYVVIEGADLWGEPFGDDGGASISSSRNAMFVNGRDLMDPLSDETTPHFPLPRPMTGEGITTRVEPLHASGPVTIAQEPAAWNHYRMKILLDGRAMAEVHGAHGWFFLRIVRQVGAPAPATAGLVPPAASLPSLSKRLPEGPGAPARG